jgi:hypothetical protein
MFNHKLPSSVPTLHEKQQMKLHNLQTTKTQENNKDIKKQNVVPLKFVIANHPIPWHFFPITSISAINHSLGQSRPPLAILCAFYKQRMLVTLQKT